MRNKNVFHALVECKAAQKVWKFISFANDVKILDPRYMMGVLQEILRKKWPKELESIVALCWSIWYLRNVFIFKNKKEDLQILVARAEVILKSYRRIKVQLVKSPQT